MPIFYENFLKKTVSTNTYFEEEEIETKNITIEKLSSLSSDMPISKIPNRVVYTQGNEKYCIVKISDFIYSFSFIASSKVNIEGGLALTFGLLKNNNYTVGQLANRTTMADYRDSSTRVNVATAIVALWKIILAYFKKSFPNNKLIYRSDLEDHEHAVVSNLNAFLDNNSIPKMELLSKINKIMTKIQLAKTYKDIALDTGKNKYYGTERDLEKEISEKEKKDMLTSMKFFKLLIKKNKKDVFSKEDIDKMLSKFERKKIIRTSLYTAITQMSYGISKTKAKIKNLNQDNFKTILDEIEQQIKDDATIDLKDANGIKIRIINDKEEIKNFRNNIEKIIMNNNSVGDKKRKLEELVDDFYADNIQTINYEKNNRYVVIK